MKPFKSYETVKPYTEVEKLPAGCYVAKILDAEEVTYSWGSVLLISLDVSEGEYSGFFKKDYSNQTAEDKKWKGTYRMNIPKEDGTEQDEWTARKFKTGTTAIEESNAGYHWDWNEAGLKGKTVGAMFRNKEYEFNGNHGFFTECCGLAPAALVRDGKIKTPKDKLLNKVKNNEYSSPELMDDEYPSCVSNDDPFQ